MGGHLRPLRRGTVGAGTRAGALSLDVPARGLTRQLAIAGRVVVADQLTKWLIRRDFQLYDGVTVIPDFFSLTRVHNTGAAFGLLDRVDLPFKTGLLAAISTAALVGLAAFGASLPPAHRVARVGVVLVVGGAAGNLIDRLWLGYVVDFMDFYWRGWHFWAFNVADASISIGMALIILDQLGVGRHRVSGTV
jgi:signal peptidase II